MLKSLVKALGLALNERKRSVGLVVGLAFSGAAFALGMGGISVITGLGEPLKADIELVAVTSAEKNNLTARLASPEVFKSAGVEYPFGLPQLKFKIETRAEGGQYIRVTSVDPLNEPFVSLLVELSWPSGKLLREYTFLLDPPNFKPELMKEAGVQPVAPSVSAAPEPKPAPVQGEAAPIRATAPVDEKAFAAAAPAAKPAAGGVLAGGTIKVNRGDTLGKIAKQLKPANVSLERMLVALYRANAEAFGGNNMNRLKSGKILRIPDQAELNNVNQAESVSEIHAQAIDWNVYRQKLAAASVAVTEQAPKQEISGKISTTVADKAPAAKETAKEVVRLSKGEAPSGKGAGGASDKARQEEEAIARSKALQESSERIAMLEKNTKAMQRLIELKSQAAAKPEAKAEVKPETKPGAKVETPVVVAKPEASAAAAAVASAVAPVSAVEAASAPQPAKPAAKPVAKPKPATPAPEPSLVDEILGNPLYLAGGAAALLALGGLALARRRKAGEFAAGKEMEDVGAVTGRILAPVAPSPDTGDFTAAAPAAAAVAAQPEEVDAISEADLFLNFGRDAQAEDILKDALGKNPANLAVMVKLMSIYAGRKDIGSFSSYAQKVKDTGDAAAWEHVAEMGRKLEPGNPAYGGVAVEPKPNAVAEMPAGEQAEPVVDFDLGLGAQENEPAAGATSGEKAAVISSVDFDLGLEEPQAPLSEATVVMQPGEMPIIEAAPSEEKESAVQDRESDAATSLDFDVTATNPSLAVPGGESAEAETATANLEEMIVDVTAERSFVPAPTEETTAVSQPGSAGEEDAFMLDFALENKPAAPAEQVETKKSLDIDLSEINLDMGESTVAVPRVEARDTNWHDVATKLDLAKAYQEMGDAAGAREILDEVLREGDAQQREIAEEMLKQLPG